MIVRSVIDGRGRRLWRLYLEISTFQWSVRILFTRCPVFQSGELQVRAAVSPHRRQDDHLQEVRPRHGHGPRGGQGMGTQVKQIVRLF